MLCCSVRADPSVDLMQLSHPLMELSTNVENHIVARRLPRFGIENRPPSTTDVSSEHLYILQDVVSNFCCRLCMWITLHVRYILRHMVRSPLVLFSSCTFDEWQINDRWLLLISCLPEREIGSCSPTRPMQNGPQKVGMQGALDRPGWHAGLCLVAVASSCWAL